MPCIHKHIYTYIHICPYTHKRTHLYPHIRTHLYTHTYMYAFIHTYTYTHTHAPVCTRALPLHGATPLLQRVQKRHPSGGSTRTLLSIHPCTCF